jgi:RHS repeat-associated protein
VILPSGRTYGFGYDANGNRTSITMPSGAVHGLGYTRVNLDNSYTPPGNPAYATSYDLDREWVRTTLPSGRAIDGGYDNGGRLLSVLYPEAGVFFAYADNTDRVSMLTRSSATDNEAIAFSYDGFLITRVAFSGVSTGEYRYAYNNDFRITGVALDNVWTTINRDNDGLLTQYGPFTITRSGPAGAPSTLTDNTLSISYTYDSFGRLQSRTHTVAGQPVYQLNLSYDSVGRISRKVETVSGVTSSYDYSYDLDGQLSEVHRDGVLVEQYAYDNNANRTSTLSTSATYDEQDRMIQQGGLSYTFDADGFLTQRGSDTFQYSARGELLSATVGGQTIAYQYDGISRRVGRTDTQGTYQYLYGNPGSPFQVTATRDTSGVLTNYFYDTAGNLFSFERGGQVYYVATDQLGTPKAVTDATGAVVKTVEYDAWGVKISDSNPTFDLPIGFAGGIEDSVTGLVRFGFRDYEPGTGRWVAKDPILFRGRQGNLYTYAGNSPIHLKDSNGLKYYIIVTESLGGGVAFISGEGGIIYVIDPCNGNVYEYGYVAGGIGLGFGGAGSLQVGVIDMEDPSDITGFGLMVSAFAAAGPGVSADISGTGPFGNGAAGATVGVAGGAGAGIAGELSRTWLTGTYNVSALPSNIKNAATPYSGK